MFFGMTFWLFFRKEGRLSGIVASLMALLGTQCLVQLCFILNGVYLDEHCWTVMTGIDIVAVPFYALILRELVRPGSVSRRVAAANILPFAIAALLYIATALKPIYWLMVAGAGLYGTAYLIWTHINIRIYNRKLKEMYSYTENIDLNWLRKILWFFFVLLAVWIADTLAVHVNMDCIYLTVSMTMWMVIDYFIYRHKNVMDSLNMQTAEAEAETAQLSELGARIERLFAEELIHLNPDLKISDVAAAVGSNRTYVSGYFNREAETTFYDYVNRLRVEHACRLLRESNESVKAVAGKSGYNSPQSFIRVFSKMKGVTPSDFRSGKGE